MPADTFLTSEEQTRDPSTALDRGVTELLPGNVTYRLRAGDDSYWTPVPPDKTSTYLYPNDEARQDALHSGGIGEEYSLARLRDSLMGIPTFLQAMYPSLRYFRPRSLRVEGFRRHNDTSRWRYDTVAEVTLPANQSPSSRATNTLRDLDTHAQAFAASIIVPFQPQRGRPRLSVRPPGQLDQLFASIIAYLENDIGYLQLFYEYTSTLRLKKVSARDTVDAYPRLRRLFYGPDSTPEQPDPRMAAYEITTQGLEFTVSAEFCRAVALRVLLDNDLRLHFRQRYIAYRLAKEARSIESTVLPLRYIQLSRLVVTYWLARHIAANPIDPRKWALSVADLQEIRGFMEGTAGTPGYWDGDQSAAVLFDGLDTNEPGDRDRIERFVGHINAALTDGFTDSRPFREYLETVVLHSLSAVVKNHCALLGGVAPEALVVYADLPGLDRVSQPDQPRILVLDSVSGGSGAIGQAFENLTRKPEQTTGEDRNLWDLLQTGLGACPVGDGEMLLRRFLLDPSRTPQETISFIEDVRRDSLGGPTRLRQAIEAAGFVIPDDPTFETVARVIFAGEVYVAESEDPDDDAAAQLTGSVSDGTDTDNDIMEDTNAADTTLLTPSAAIQPPLIVYELLRQENALQQRIGYRPQPEVVVAATLNTIGTDTWPYVETLHQAICDDLATNIAIPDQVGALRRQMTSQLLGLMPRRCDDGCPVCLVNGSNMEDRQTAAYVNSRRILHQIREMLFVESVPQGYDPVNDLIDPKAVRYDNRQHIPEAQAGTLQIKTLNDDGTRSTTTVLPAESIDRGGRRRYLSLYKGTPLDSRGEVMIANYLDLRSNSSDWVYVHGPEMKLWNSTARQEERMLPDFVVQVPYLVGDEQYQQEIIIEFWGMENDEGYDARREVKESCYRSARKALVSIEPADLLENAFVGVIEDGVRQAIMQVEPGAIISLPPLGDAVKRARGDANEPSHD